MTKTESWPTRRAFIKRLCIALIMAFVLVPCAWSEAYIWSLTGSDSRLGSYEGLLEIRETESESMDVIRTVSFQDFRHADGRKVDVVWTGTLSLTGARTATATFLLERADFIRRAGDVERREEDVPPLAVVGAVSWEDNPAVLHVDYAAPNDSAFRASETAVVVDYSAPEPVWVSHRRRLETHPEPGFATKWFLFLTFDDYHDLPEVRPYNDHPVFRRAVHYQIIDRTDFQYYRNNPDRLRLANKVVDPISLAEAAVAANAFGLSLAEKAGFYQGELAKALVGPHGMVVKSIDGQGRMEPDGDSALWTGIYAFTQALRYRKTGRESALDELRSSLDAIFTLMDVTGNPLTFARTLRSAGPPLTGDWRRGTGDFSRLDWLAGGNNDMAKGLVSAMLAGWDALPEGDAMRQRIPAYAKGLLELCEFEDNPPSQCGSGDADLAATSVNPAMAMLLAGITNGDDDLAEEGLAWLRRGLLWQYPDTGAGIFYAYGISDWSGNHLSLVSTLILQRLLAQTGDAELHRKWIDASLYAWRTLRPLQPALHAALAVAAGAVQDHGELSDATEHVLWGLRSFPCPKHPYPVDHRIRGDFVLSPLPALAWKNDWLRNPKRQQSIAAYPILEQPMDSYLWKNAHFAFKSEGLGDKKVPGVDYLFLYWLGVDGGIIGSGE